MVKLIFLSKYRKYIKFLIWKRFFVGRGKGFFFVKFILYNFVYCKKYIYGFYVKGLGFFLFLWNVVS